eukprot:g9007.t1
MANFLANSQAEQASRRQNGEDIQLIDPLSSPPLQGTTRGKSKSGFPGSSTASTRLDSPNPVLNSPSPDRARPPESDAGAAPGAGVVGNDFDLFSWQDGLYGSGGSSINTVSGRGGGPGALNAGVSGIGAHQSEASGSPYEHPYKKNPGRGPHSVDPELGLDQIVLGFGLREFGNGSRHLQRRVVKHWLVFQAVGWCLLVMLYLSETNNQKKFDAELALNCRRDPESGICVGPEWRQVLYKDVQLNGGADGGEVSFDFTTTSQPPTALVVVDPYLEAPPAPPSQGEDGAPTADKPDVFFPPTSKARPDAETSTGTHYRVRIDRIVPGLGAVAGAGAAAGAPGNNGFLTVVQRGAHAFSVEDYSDEARQAGTLTWRKPSRYRIYVQDVTMSADHIRKLTTDAQCAFEGAWKKFNEKHQGRDEDASIARSEWVMNAGILMSVVFIALVYRMFDTQEPDTRRLAQLQLAKFVCCDFPVQISLVGYFLNWYDKSGMRCQMCLFDIDHCEVDYLFHGLNVFVVFFILGSAALTSLLLVKYHREHEKVYTDDEICMIKSLQLGAICVAVLPFSTGFLMISRDQLLFPVLSYIVVGIPCVIGWVCVAFLVCYPFLCMMEEDRYEYGHVERRHLKARPPRRVGRGRASATSRGRFAKGPR